jgi:hypothetical protein
LELLVLVVDVNVDVNVDVEVDEFADIHKLLLYKCLDPYFDNNGKDFVFVKAEVEATVVII